MSCSSAEVEYRGVANAVAECSWLRQLLGELHCFVQGATITYYDNVSSVYMARNPVHIDEQNTSSSTSTSFTRRSHSMRSAFYRFQALASLRTSSQKGLASSLFSDFRDSLCVGSSTTVTKGGVSELVYAGPCVSSSDAVRL
jgi:hypothetical protein